MVLAGARGAGASQPRAHARRTRWPKIAARALVRRDARPLSPSQLQYAAADAVVLLDIALAMGVDLTAAVEHGA